jgi:hypothetical protein
MPAEYYSSPVSDVKPIVPKWVPFGCGGAAIFFLICLAAFGFWLASGGMSMFLDMSLGQIATQLREQMQKDVTAAKKSEFEKELESLRENVRTERLPIDRLQPVLREMQTVVDDSKVTADELDRLTTVVRNSNKPLLKKPAAPAPGSQSS